MERSPHNLVDRLAELELEQATLQAELAAFRHEYMARVGVLMMRVEELKARHRRLEAERAGRREEAATARAAEDEAQRSTQEAEAVPSPTPRPTGDLKKLYREAAKRMHPDLAADDAGREHAEAFMKRLNRAYQDGDAEAIADLLRQWGVEWVPEEDSTALAAAVEAAQRRLAATRASELAGIMEQVMAATARGEDLLAEMHARARAELARWEGRVARLEGRAT